MAGFPTVRMFFQWWWRELRWLFPGFVVRAFTGGRTHLFLIVRGDTVDLAEGTVRPEKRRGSVSTAGRDDAGLVKAVRSLSGKRLGKRPLVAVIPSTQVLRRSLLVPDAARRNLRTVLEFQLGKTTPFDPQEVVFDYRIDPHQRSDGKLKVKLGVAARAAVDDAVRVASRAGYDPVAVRAEAEEGDEDCIFDFSPAGKGTSETRIWAALTVVLAILAVALVGTATALPFAYQRAALESLTDEIAQMRAKAKTVAAMRQHSAAAAARRNFLASQKRASVLHTKLLHDLTRRIPDGAWLVQASTSGRTIRIHGFAPSAASLMAELERAPEFQDLSVVSKMVRDRDSDLESFQLSLQATPEAE